MGKYEGRWKHIDGERMYIVVKDGVIFRSVLLRDGVYEYNDSTMNRSTVLKFRGMPLEKQVMKTIDGYLSDKNSTERQIDSAVHKMNEVYRDDW